MTPRRSSADIPDQSGRTVVVTGANSGLGLATARRLAGAGARVVLAVRDPERGARAAAGITGTPTAGTPTAGTPTTGTTTAGTTEVRRLDLADLDSVRAFAAGWDEPLAVLVNNAGIMAVPARVTVDGFESQFGTNHLGHFALTNLLLPHVTDRVVTVSSTMHKVGTIDLDDLNWQARPYSAERAYGQSKLANLLFTLELQRRLTAAGSAVRSLAAHPGWAATDLQRHSGSRVRDAVLALANRLLAATAEQGALPTLFAATADVPGGSYVGPDGLLGLRGQPTLVGRTAAASDVVLAERLWAASVELTGVDLPAALAR